MLKIQDYLVIRLAKNDGGVKYPLLDLSLKEAQTSGSAVPLYDLKVNMIVYRFLHVFKT